MDKDTTQNVPVHLLNQRVLDYLDRGEVEKVAQASSDYTRIQLREDSFCMKILTPQKATDDMLDRDLDERLRIIEELEPDSPGAKWVPLQDVPDGEYIYGSRYQIPFARVLTPKFVKDIDELRTYRQDIRKILTQNAIKDGLAEIDGKFIETCVAIAEDTSGSVPGQQSFTGKVQWIAMSGGLTKDNFVEAKKMLPRGNAQGRFRLRNYIALMNDVTAQDWLKLDHDEIGNETVTRFFNEGLTTDTYLGLKCIFTIKDDLVPDNRVWFFAAPEFLGKAYYLTDWTMYMKKEAYFIEMFAYWLGGFAIGNVAGVCVADFDYS
jgi:hypothetical protein